MPTPRIPFPTTPSEYIVAPTGGWSPDIPRWELAADQAPLLENFQIKPGKLRVRPPYKVTADLTSSAPSLAGWVPLKHGTSLLTKRLFTSTYSVEPQNVHRVGVSVPSSLTPTDDALYSIAGSTVTRTALTGGEIGFAPGWSQIDFNGVKYAISYASPSGSRLTFNDGVAGYATAVTTLTTTTVAGITYAPQGGFYIYGWLDRVWVAGGAPGTTGLNPSTTALFFSNPLQTFTSTPADWEDPVSGLYNQIDVDGNHNDPIVALASVPAGLIILRQNSLFILRGTDPTTYVLRPISKQAGCLDARSVVEIDSKVYWMSEQGFMVTDGTQVQNISGALQDELYRQVATWNNAVFNGTGAWCTASKMSDGKILVSFGTYLSGGSGLPYTMSGTFSAVFDPATGVWVKVTTGIAPVGATNTLGPSIQGYGEVTTLSNFSSVKIEDNVTGQAVTAASSLNDQTTVAGALTPIIANWRTRSPQANLASRGKIHIKRAYLDYAISTGGPGGQMAMQLLNNESTGAPLLTKTIAVSTASSNQRQYLQVDNFGEVADLGINVTVVGDGTTGLAVNKAEVHGVGIEFSATSDMRPTV